MTETLRAIAQIRDSFPMGSEEFWECVRWYERCIQIERETRANDEKEKTCES